MFAGGFARGQLVQFQQMGFGIAVALLLDATLIRMVILPSMLSLLDRRSWYLPRWLGWLSHLLVESPEFGSADGLSGPRFLRYPQTIRRPTRWPHHEHARLRCCTRTPAVALD